MPVERPQFQRIPATSAALPAGGTTVLRVGFVFAIYVIVSALVLNSFMQQWELLTDQRGSGFLGFVNHTANRPWVYRVLTPAVINAAADAIPPRAKLALEPLVMSSSHLLKFPRIRNTPAWTLEIAIKYHLAYLILFGCLLLSLVTLRFLTGALFFPPPSFQDFGPALALLLLPLTFIRGGYLYDFPELLLMGLAIACAVKRKWLLFYGVFILAILNKESDILLVLFFVVFALPTMPLRRLIAHVALQGAIGIAIICVVRHAFADHAGNSMQIHLGANLRHLMDPRNYLLFFDIYAPMIPVPRGFNVVSMPFVAWLMLYRWREKPRFARRLFVLTASVNVPLFLFGGYKDELRNLSMMFPAVYFLGFHTLCALYAWPSREAAACVRGERGGET
jgi:hypothetical protein